jgi:RNA polymerase sigma-70 factor (ECF subfamily)
MIGLAPPAHPLGTRPPSLPLAGARRWLRWLLALAAHHDPRRLGRDAPATARAAAGATPPGGAGGPTAVMDEIYRAHARTVMAYLYHRLPTLADAEDALADVFVAALAACARDEVPGIGWLMATARRRVADFYRQRERAPHLMTAPMAAAAEQPADAAAEPEWVALSREERRELLALIARLPDEQREVLALRFASGLPSAQIAAIIGKSDEATRAILSRAVRRLRMEWVR